MPMNFAKAERARQNRQKVDGDRVPSRVKAAAEKYGWEVHIINSMWTRLKRGNISVEVRYSQRRETRGRAYRNDVSLVMIFDSQAAVVEFLAEPER